MQLDGASKTKKGKQSKHAKKNPNRIEKKNRVSVNMKNKNVSPKNARNNLADNRKRQVQHSKQVPLQQKQIGQMGKQFMEEKNLEKKIALNYNENNDIYEGWRQKESPEGKNEQGNEMENKERKSPYPENLPDIIQEMSSENLMEEETNSRLKYKPNASPNNHKKEIVN